MATLSIPPVPPLPHELSQLAMWLENIRSGMGGGSVGSDYVNVMNYGATGNGTTDDSTAIQSALTYATTYGKTVLFPSGSYLCTTPLVINNIATSAVFTGPRCNILGSGSANTRIIYPSGTGSLLTIGNTQLQYHITIQGVYLEGPGGESPGTGTALTVTNALFFTMQDVRVTGFELGMTGSDIYNMYCANSTFAYNVAGMNLQFGSFTQPNADTFVATTFAYNTKYGLDAKIATTLNFFGGTFQSNGVGGSGAFVGGVRISTGTDGAQGCNFKGTYFEENAGSADLYIDGQNSSTNSVSGCTFNRVTSSHYTTNNIYLTATSGKTVRVGISACGFGGFNTYSPSSGRMYLSAGGAGTAQMSWSGCYFQSATETPTHATLPNYITLGDGATHQSLGDIVRGVELGSTGSSSATFSGVSAPLGGDNKWLAVTSDSTGLTGYIPIWY